VYVQNLALSLLVSVTKRYSELRDEVEENEEVKWHTLKRHPSLEHAIRLSTCFESDNIDIFWRAVEVAVGGRVRARRG